MCALSGQAMGSSVLPRLWRWLATSLGLPLEAPMEATRGWDIASLQMGLRGVDPAHAAVFGLFCRCRSIPVELNTIPKYDASCLR